MPGRSWTTDCGGPNNPTLWKLRKGEFIPTPGGAPQADRITGSPFHMIPRMSSTWSGVVKEWEGF